MRVVRERAQRTVQAGHEKIFRFRTRRELRATRQVLRAGFRRGTAARARRCTALLPLYAPRDHC